MPRLIANYPYVPTASGGKPIVFIGLSANDKFTLLRATPTPERMRTGLAPSAGARVDFSDSQRVDLQFFSKDAGPVGPLITLVPELDPRLDEDAQVGEGPSLQYPHLFLGQDFLQNFWLGLLGPVGLTEVYEPFEGEQREGKGS